MKKIFGAVLCIILVLLDQATKIIAVNNLEGKNDISIINNVLELHYLRNTGAAWGIFPNATLFFVIMTLIIVAVLVYIYIKLPLSKRYKPLGYLCIFIIAGALGNMIDRVFRKYVIDFIYFKIIDFPVFNVADIYVSVSGVILVILMLFFYKDEEFHFLSKKKDYKSGDIK